MNTEQNSTLANYATWTDTTAQYPAAHEAHYLGLGIVEELGELFVAADPEAVTKECGDVMWYVARYSEKVLGVSFVNTVEAADRLLQENVNGNIFSDTVATLGVICGTEKKRLRDGESWDAEKRFAKNQAAATAIVHVTAIVLACLFKNGETLEGALNVNQSKLSARVEANTIRGDGDNR